MDQKQQKNAEVHGLLQQQKRKNSIGSYFNIWTATIYTFLLNRSLRILGSHSFLYALYRILLSNKSNPSKFSKKILHSIKSTS